MATGLPTGGIEQAARVAAGAAGDPLGRKPPGAPAPPRRRSVIPARRRHGALQRKRVLVWSLLADGAKSLLSKILLKNHRVCHEA